MLAGLHFSWALGSSWGFEKVLPTKENGERILNPTRADSAIVGLGLFLFATFYLLKTNLGGIALPGGLQATGGWVISLIFILRGIGDFRYVGFSKRVRNTTFGRLDTRYYSPLCAGLGLLGLLIEFMSASQ
jgi:hypothetical protein